MQRVTEKQITEQAAAMVEGLNSSGYNADFKRCFQYGAYGFYFEFYPLEDTARATEPRQIFTGLDTKRQTVENIRNAYYKALALKEHYQFIDRNGRA